MPQSNTVVSLVFNTVIETDNECSLFQHLPSFRPIKTAAVASLKGQIVKLRVLKVRGWFVLISRECTGRVWGGQESFVFERASTSLNLTAVFVSEQKHPVKQNRGADLCLGLGALV